MFTSAYGWWRDKQLGIGDVGHREDIDDVSGSPNTMNGDQETLAIYSSADIPPLNMFKFHE